MRSADGCKVSVVMSTYNDALYIDKAVESILSQSHSNLELLIMVDGSTDNTIDILGNFNDPRMQVTVRENKGKATSLNELIESASGEYILIQDSDDISHPERIKVLLEKFLENPSLAMVQSGFSLIVGDKIVAPKGRDLSPAECKDIIAQYRLPELDPTLMVKASVAKEFPFNPDYRIGQGIDFIFRVAEKYPMVVVSSALYFYRYNTNSNTKKNASKKMGYLCEVMNSARKRRGEPLISVEELTISQGGKRTSNDNNLSGHFTESVFSLVNRGKRMDAIRVALFSLRFLSVNYRFAKPCLYAFTPKFVGDIGRKFFGEYSGK